MIYLNITLPWALIASLQRPTMFHGISILWEVFYDTATDLNDIMIKEVIPE